MNILNPPKLAKFNFREVPMMSSGTLAFPRAFLQLSAFFVCQGYGLDLCHKLIMLNLRIMRKGTEK